MISAIKPVKLESRHCSNCQMETEQFLSHRNYEEGYKLSDARKRQESKADIETHIVSYEYTCEKCGKKNVVPTTRPAYSGTCAKCGAKMRYNESSWKWVCDNCQTSVAALAPESID